MRTIGYRAISTRHRAGLLQILANPAAVWAPDIVLTGYWAAGVSDPSRPIQCHRNLRGVAHMTKIGDDPCRPLPIALSRQVPRPTREVRSIVGGVSKEEDLAREERSGRGRGRWSLAMKTPETTANRAFSSRAAYIWAAVSRPGCWHGSLAPIPARYRSRLVQPKPARA
jgi:hypothetical protein